MGLAGFYYYGHTEKDIDIESGDFIIIVVGWEDSNVGKWAIV